VLNGDFRRINPAQARVVLLEAGPRVLASFPKSLSERAARDLAQLGVEVRTGSKVGAIDGRGVTIGSEKLLAHSVFWAAGVRGRICPDTAACRDRPCRADQSHRRFLRARSFKRLCRG
jgi:NADH dehydrogenase FAD-containing subunit